MKYIASENSNKFDRYKCIQFTLNLNRLPFAEYRQLDCRNKQYSMPILSQLKV